MDQAKEETSKRGPQLFDGRPAGCHDEATAGGDTEHRTEPVGAVSWGVDLCGRKSPVATDGPGCGGIRQDLFARSTAQEEEGEERPAASERVSPRRGRRGETPHRNERGSMWSGEGLVDWKAGGSPAATVRAVSIHTAWRIPSTVSGLRALGSVLRSCAPSCE